MALRRMQKMIQAISLDGYILIWHLFIFLVVMGWVTVSDYRSGQSFLTMANGILCALLIVLLSGYGIVMHTKVVKPFKKIYHILSTRKDNAVVQLYDEQELMNQDVREVYLEIDQLLNGLNKYGDAMHRSFAVLRDQSDQLSATLQENQAAHGEIAGSISKAADLSENQLGNVKEMSTHVVTIHQSIRTVGAHMRTLSQLSQQCETAIKNGMVVSNETENKIREIIQYVKHSEHASLEMTTQFTALNDVVTVIDDIARQIKLLSLNASIEAEHAGASGKGFAVVAQEINNLARDTTKSVGLITQSVTAMNSSIQNNAESSRSVLKMAQDGVDAVKANTSVFEKVEHAVDSVLARIQKMATEVGNVSREFDQSVASYTHLGEMATHIFKETETVSAAAEEQNASMEEIAHSAEALVRISEEFDQLLTAKSY